MWCVGEAGGRGGATFRKGVKYQPGFIPRSAARLAVVPPDAMPVLTSVRVGQNRA